MSSKLPTPLTDPGESSRAATSSGLDEAGHHQAATGEPVLLRFATFELDLSDEELRRAGVRVHLTGKPFRLLALLAGNAGRLVRREVIRQHLWEADSYGEFDQNINTLVRDVRRALGDRASAPRFVATEPRRGYRFVAPVEAVCRSTAVASRLPSGAAAARQAIQKLSGWDRLLAVIVPVLVAGTVWAALRRRFARSA